MLDQNTDRMWYVIGAVIVGAAIIFLVNSSFPQLFASVGDTFQSKTEEVMQDVDAIGKKEPNGINPNMMPDSGGEAIHNVRRYYSSKIVEEDGKLAIRYNTSSNIIQMYSDDVVLKDGETYTMSFYAKADNPISLGGNIYLNSKNARDYELNGSRVSKTTITTEWVRYSFTFIFVGDGNIMWHMYPHMNHEDGTKDAFYLTEWKLEKGDKMTPWVL